LKIVAGHAYITTAMASLLNISREAGVLATSEFIWLKPLDRRMWFMLNSVGRPTAVAEISGAFAHWLAEKKLGIPLVIPMVDEAVTGLELALKDILYKPQDD
jgi:intracellular multiplication protein IcmP